jgi:chaperonin cofactor prefoldin
MSTSATDFTTTTITEWAETPDTGTIKYVAGGTSIPFTFDEAVPMIDTKTERLEARVKELEGHLCDLIDVVAHLKAELYDA